MSSSGLAPVVLLSHHRELARVAAGGEPRKGDTLNLSSRLHPGRLLAYRVVEVERWYGDVGPPAARSVAAGEVMVRVDQVDGAAPVPPVWLGSSPFAPVVLLHNGIELARTSRDAEPRPGEVIKLDSPHRLGRLRAYRVLRVERWPADLEDDEAVITWGDIGVHLAEIEV